MDGLLSVLNSIVYLGVFMVRIPLRSGAPLLPNSGRKAFEVQHFASWGIAQHCLHPASGNDLVNPRFRRRGRMGRPIKRGFLRFQRSCIPWVLDS